MAYLQQLKQFKKHMLDSFDNATGDGCTTESVNDFFDSTFEITFRGKTINIPVCAEVFGAIEEIITFEIEEMGEI